MYQVSATGMFAANTVAWWAPQIRAGDEVRWPYGAVETAPIDERDIAAVAVRALTEASLAGGDYVLTGPEALSHARQVAVISEVLGRRLACWAASAITWKTRSMN